MRVFKNLSVEIPGTNVHYFNLDELSISNSEEALFYGYAFLQDLNLSHKDRGNFVRNVYLNMTSPTEFCSPQPTNADSIFDEVYSICPYTNEWLNGVFKTKKYRDIFYPFNERDIPYTEEKKYDVIYHGGIHSWDYIKLLTAIRKFDYRYATQTHGINHLTQQCVGVATNVNLSNEGKLKLISECRISVCLNTFPVVDHAHVNNVIGRKDWDLNQAFSKVYELGIAPQFKSRFNEAAFCKTLNLVKRDPWNLVERYYDKDEFVYFDSMEELPDKITEVLKWPKEDYNRMVEKAFNKSLNYTTKKLYYKIKNESNNEV